MHLCIMSNNFHRSKMLLLKIGSRKIAIYKGSKKRMLRAKWRARAISIGIKVVYPQVLFRDRRQPFRGNNQEWYPRETSGWARGLRVLERMVIMERCILTMFITEGARHHNSLSALRTFLSWNCSRCGCTFANTCTMHSYHWSTTSS